MSPNPPAMGLEPPSTMLTSAAPQPPHAPPSACCACSPWSVRQGLNRHPRCQLFPLRTPHQHICNHSTGQTPGQAEPLRLGDAWLQLDLSYRHHLVGDDKDQTSCSPSPKTGKGMAFRKEPPSLRGLPRSSTYQSKATD